MNLSSLVLTLVASLLVTFGALIGDRSVAWMELPRRWTWLTAMLGSISIPFAGRWLPDFGLGWTVRKAFETSGTTDLGYALSSGVAPLGSLWMWVAGWTALSILVLGIMLGSYRRVRRKVDEGASSVVDGRAVILCPTAGPLVLGFLHPKLVVPQWILDVPPAERALIFEHELQHMMSRDTLVLVFGSLLLVVMPWNPFLWIQHSRLRLSIEIDCDRRVLQKGVTLSSYGQALLRAAGGMRGQSWFVPAWRESNSHLRARIISMTQPSSPYGRFLAVPGALLAGLLLLAACDVGTPGGAPDQTSAPQAQQAPASEAARADSLIEREIPIEQSASAAAGNAQATGVPVVQEVEEREIAQLREAVRQAEQQDRERGSRLQYEIIHVPVDGTGR